MPDTILSALILLAHQTFTINICRIHYQCSCFMNEETDEQYYFAQDYIVINGKAKILKAQPEHSATGMNLPSTCL